VKSLNDLQKNFWPSHTEFGKGRNKLIRANAAKKSATRKTFHHDKHVAEPIRIAVRQEYAWRRKMRIGKAVLDSLFEPGLNGIGASGIESEDHFSTAALATQAKSVHLREDSAAESLRA
jgi:hypothetical protein